MSDRSKSRPVPSEEGRTYALSLSLFENALSDSGTSNASDTPVAVDSSILSETLSNIDFDGFLEVESDNPSGSESTPMVPWNVRAGTRNEGGNTLVTQSYNLANNRPRLNHFESRSGRGDPRKRRRDPSPRDGGRMKGKGKRTVNKFTSKSNQGIPMCECKQVFSLSTT
ncbi:hypothetical protein AX15_002955 [Amanita polypyramis BW_CC]|nr:hypothetical protein AX15_002955 [Amanita polypyramis BW_CC]